jgi:hypothetical protein
VIFLSALILSTIAVFSIAFESRGADLPFIYAGTFFEEKQNLFWKRSFTIRPRLFYLLDYGFLPQNVRGKKKEEKKPNFSVTRKYKSSPSAITAI